MEGNGTQPEHKAQWVTQLHVIIPKEQLSALEAWSQKNSFKILEKNETVEVFLERLHSSEAEANAQVGTVNNDEDFQDMRLLSDMPEYLTIAKRIELEG